MLYQIALSVTLLIFAFTGLPKALDDNFEKSSPKEQAIEPRHQTSAFRPTDLDKPKPINVRFIDPSLNEIARWLSANFDLPYANDPPRIERVAPTRLNRLRYKGMLPSQSQAIGGEHATPRPEFQREVVAVYDDSTRTIYLPEHWTGDTAAEQSVLVHEMVHHLQNVAGLKYECGGAREKPAYLAQDRWLKLHGLELEKEFEVDMFTIIGLSACMN